MCKNIGYEFYCRKLFVVKHKSKYSCESAIHFYLGSEIIKENYNFAYYFDKTDIKSVVPDIGNEIILANWPNNKHIECNINNAIPVRIPSFPYVLVKRIEEENHFLLESLAACHDTQSKLIMYLTVNTTFINYLSNLNNSLKFPFLLNWTTHEQTLPISLQSFNFDHYLLKSLKACKDLVHQFQHKGKFLICKNA